MVSKVLCSKEAELAEMHTDIKWIRKELEGNGKKGLVREVRENSTHRIESETKSRILKLAVGAGWGITIATLIINMF